MPHTFAFGRKTLSTTASKSRHSSARSRLLAAFAVLSLAAVSPAGADADASGAPPVLDRWVERAMHTFEVPGLAVTIVRDGETIAARGYGVRRLGERAAVDERTLFGIASNT